MDRIVLSNEGPVVVFKKTFKDQDDARFESVIRTLWPSYRSQPGNFCYRKINDETLCTFQALVERLDWTSIYLEQSAESAFRKFSEEFRKIYDLAFPVVKSRTVKSKFRKPWLNDELYERIRIKNNMYHAFVKSRDKNLLTEFKQIRNKLNSDLKNAKSEYFLRKFEGNYDNPRKLWDMVNNLTNKDTSVYSAHTISVDGRNVAGEELANIMNEHFINIGAPREQDTDCESGGAAKTSNISSSIMLAPTSPNEISNSIKQIKTSVAAGIDEIKPLPIKVASNV